MILPGLQRKSRNDEHELMLWEEVVLEGVGNQLGGHLVAAPFRKRGRGGNGGGLPSPYDYLRLLEQERSGNEDARVLYVAATRAIRSLHLVGVARTNAEGEAGRSAGSFLDLLWPAVSGDFATAAECGGEAVVSPADDSRYAPKLVRVVSPAMPGILNRPPSVKPQGHEVTTMEDAEQGAGYSLDASVGTLVHAYLEMIARSGADAWTSERIHSLLAAMTLWLSQRGHAAGEAKEAAARVELCLNSTLGSEEGRWVLARREDAAAEMAVTALDRDKIGDSGHDRIATHVVDRSFVEDGVRWIIDYKTAQLDGDETALRYHAERYRAQLERYARLFADEGLPLRLGIFYVARGRLVELPVCAGLSPGVSSNHTSSSAR